MPQEICSQCSVCDNRGIICGGQTGIFFAEACPSSDDYVGNGRWT